MKGQMSGVVAVVAMVAMGAVATMVGGGLAYAQGVAEVSVGFQWVAGKTTFPAGKYRISSDEQGTITITPERGATVAVEPITRLAEPATPLTAARLVFDNVGGERYLSEVWLPDEEGYLLRDTRQKHTHEVVRGVKAAKR